MRYAILCYNNEDEVFAWTEDQDRTVMAKLAAVHERWRKDGKLGPAVRLMPTTTATTLKKDRDPPIVMDGPFAETKEQLLGFYIVDFANLEEALAGVRELARANPGGAYELRPLLLFEQGVELEPLNGCG